MGHDTSSIEASVDVCSPSGEVNRFSFSAVWCEDCNAYYISEDIFRELQSRGTILCRVFSLDKFINRNTMFDGFNQQSILYSYGYNVNAKDNKSDLERRAVLDRVIEHGIMSKDEIISFLLYLIDRPTGNRNMSQSIRKWRSDIEYLSGKKTQIKAGRIKMEDIDWEKLMSSIKKDMPF